MRMSEDMSAMGGTPLVGGKYLMYKDRPLVREGDTICYGDLSEKYILVLEIMSYKEEGGEKLPNDIFIQVLEAADQTNCVRQGKKEGLFEAFSYGLIWLEQALAKAEKEEA